MRWLAQQLGTLQMRQMDRQSCLMHEGMHKGMSNDVVGLGNGQNLEKSSPNYEALCNYGVITKEAA